MKLAVVESFLWFASLRCSRSSIGIGLVASVNAPHWRTELPAGSWTCPRTAWRWSRSWWSSHCWGWETGAGSHSLPWWTSPMIAREIPGQTEPRWDWDESKGGNDLFYKWKNEVNMMWEIQHGFGWVATRWQLTMPRWMTTGVTPLSSLAFFLDVSLKWPSSWTSPWRDESLSAGELLAAVVK